jgi:hypothetical protein
MNVGSVLPARGSIPGLKLRSPLKRTGCAPSFQVGNQVDPTDMTQPH